MEKFPVSVVSERRWRDEMEDTHCVVPNFAGNEEWFFGGVFDGHGGRSVADGLARDMAGFVEESIAKGASARIAQRVAYKKALKADWAQAYHSGSCSATFIARGEIITCANVGDCRIVALGRYVRQLTRDHNTHNKSEAQRIRRRGTLIDGYGYVEYGDRLIAVTRAIGDLHFKNAGLISTPFISSYMLKPTDRFIVAASDGLFGKTSNKRVLALSREVKTADEFAQALKQEVEQRNGSDNLTIIVVQVK